MHDQASQEVYSTRVCRGVVDLPPHRSPMCPCPETIVVQASPRLEPKLLQTTVSKVAHAWSIHVRTKVLPNTYLVRTLIGTQRRMDAGMNQRGKHYAFSSHVHFGPRTPANYQPRVSAAAAAASWATPYRQDRAHRRGGWHHQRRRAAAWPTPPAAALQTA